MLHVLVVLLTVCVSANRAVDKMENAKVEIDDGKDFQKEEDTLCK